jgi:hypothetical protein
MFDRFDDPLIVGDLTDLRTPLEPLVLEGGPDPDPVVLRAHSRALIRGLLTHWYEEATGEGKAALRRELEELEGKI